MQYEWRCNVCDKHVVVTRTLDEYDVPPTSKEASDAGDILIARNCIHPETWVKVYNSSTPFETLRDRSVFERTHFKRGT